MGWSGRILEYRGKGFVGKVVDRSQFLPFTIDPSVTVHTKVYVTNLGAVMDPALETGVVLMLIRGRFEDK